MTDPQHATNDGTVLALHCAKCRRQLSRRHLGLLACTDERKHHSPGHSHHCYQYQTQRHQKENCFLAAVLLHDVDDTIAVQLHRTHLNLSSEHTAENLHNSAYNH